MTESHRERLLVAISAHPIGEQLIVTAQRLSQELNAELYAIYVQTPDRIRYSGVHAEQVARTIQMAESLGARVVTVQSRSIPQAILEFAAQEKITKILIGKPLRPRWQELLQGNIVEQIIRGSGTADVYVITDAAGPVKSSFLKRWRPSSPLSNYLVSIGLVVLVTLISIPIHFFILPINLVMLYLVAVVVAALYLGRGPGILASLLSSLAFDFFFLDPRLSLSIANSQHLLTVFGLLAVSLVISNLASLVQTQVDTLRRREAEASALYALGRDLATAVELQAVAKAIILHVGKTLSRETVLLLPEHDVLKVYAVSPGFEMQASERELAEIAFSQGQETGRGTFIEPSARSRYLPLITSQGVVGVLGVRPIHPDRVLTPDQHAILEGFASLAALAVERTHLAEQASQAQVLKETEKLQSALLNSISHDLRTPLASITGVLSTLRESEGVSSSGPIYDPATRLELLDTAWDESNRLNRLVGNLLDISRLEAGALKVHCNALEMQDIIGSAIAQVSSQIKDHPIQVNVPDQIPLVSADFVLLVQVVANLIDNAAKYSPPGSPIEITVDTDEGNLRVSVCDHGSGIPTGELERVFDKFYRIQQRDGASGTGLGLAICKGIVEAHGGRIWAENRPKPEKGSIFRFTLPVTQDTGASE